MSGSATYRLLEQYDSEESYCPEEFDLESEEHRAAALADDLRSKLELDVRIEDSSTYQDGAMFTVVRLYELDVKFPPPLNISTSDWEVGSAPDGAITLLIPNHKELEEHMKATPDPIAVIFLSCFGSLATIWECLDNSMFQEMSRLLQKHKYRPVDSETLEQPYTGNNEDSVGKTWTHRYFCFCAWA